MHISKLLFGEIALKKQLVTKEQVEECLEIQKRLKEMGISKTLGAIMHDKKYLSMVEIKEILREMTGQKDWNAIEGYEIIGKLGKGGMGSVYKARHARLNKTVALKVLPPELAGDQEYLDRFMREAHAAAKLNHPNIVQALDVGESYGYHYFVMEYVDGVTVKELIDKHGHIEEHTAIDIVIQVAQALEHAWKNEIVHRDIKPSNIIIAKGNVTKLCDLGLAKTADDDATITQTGVIMGTPFYLSPEQARSEPLDCRSDIYSLGVTFFHMLTGQVPFTGNSAATILYKHIFLDPPNPKSLNPSLHDETVRVVRKMLAKRKEDRYANPTELLKDLHAVLQKVEPPASTPLPTETDSSAQGAETEQALALTQDEIPLSARDATLAATTDLDAEARVLADDFAAARREVARQRQARRKGGVSARTRWLAAGVSGLGLAAAIAVLAVNLFFTTPPSPVSAEVNPGNLFESAPVRPDVAKAIATARAQQAQGQYARALETLNALPARPPLAPKELSLVLRTRDAIVRSARERLAELEKRQRSGQNVLKSIRDLDLPAIVDRLKAHRRWLAQQRPLTAD